MEQNPVGIYERWHAITNEEVTQWISAENLARCAKRTFEGFELVDSIDGRPDPSTEVSLVNLLNPGEYPQHIHKKSDAYFIVVSGEATFLSGEKRTPMKVGDRMDVPRGTSHGFETVPGTSFKFISFQSPPIRDEHGHEDFHLVHAI